MNYIFKLSQKLEEEPKGMKHELSWLENQNMFCKIIPHVFPQKIIDIEALIIIIIIFLMQFGVTSWLTYTYKPNDQILTSI